MADETGDRCASVIDEARLSCATCAQIIDFFNTASDRDKISLGSISSLIDTACPHGAWIKNFRPNISKVQGFSESTMMLRKTNSSIQLNFSRNGLSHPGSRSELVFRKNTGRHHPGRARLLDPKWIDEGVILTWKDSCNEHHEDTCEHPEELGRLDAVQPTWLIDTTDACLVPGRGEMRYISLSYTRGQTVSLYDEKSTIDRLQRPGVLAVGPLAEKVPRTIRNAIDIDNLETMQVELDSMAKIYSTSYLTIVAADGSDASYGLRGFKGLTPQRDVKKKKILLASPENLIIPITRDQERQSGYYPRAWTFPDLQSMNILIWEFNRRILTFPDEALLAFSGVQWVLGQTFSGCVLYGIPELFFEIGLMWNPAEMGERRHSTRRSQLESRLPSWSFLGWQVSATFKHDFEFQACWYLRDEHVKGVDRAITTWYTMDYPTSSNKRRIESDWYKYKNLAQETTQKPLKGWMRHDFTDMNSYGLPGKTLSYSGDGPEYGYSHFNSPERFYKYPVPFLDATKQYPPRLQTQFLSCKTSRAFIHGVPRTPRGEGGLGDSDNFKEARLQDPDRNVVGFLTLMQSGDREVFAEKTAPVTLVELVAISEGWFGGDKSGEEDKEIKDWTPGFPRRACYHVLWVEWEAGTAYRRGNVCVLKGAWEKLREDDLVDLILG